MARGMTVYTLAQALPVAEVTVTGLPPSTRDAIWLDLRSMRSLDDDDDKNAVLARVRTMAARHPGERLPTVTLAKYLIEADLPAEAVTILAPIVAAEPADTEALWLTASAEMDLAEELDDEAARTALMRQAQRRLGVAYEADPLDYRVYMAMNRAREGATGYPSDNDLTIALSAYRLAPQLGSTAYRAGQVLIAKGQFAEAVQVLSPLANNPHGGGDLAAVRTLLAEARRRCRPRASVDRRAALRLRSRLPIDALEQGVEHDMHRQRASDDEAEAGEHANRRVNASLRQRRGRAVGGRAVCSIQQSHGRFLLPCGVRLTSWTSRQWRMRPKPLLGEGTLEILSTLLRESMPEPGS